MANDQALAYIRQRMTQSGTREQIMSELKASGWQDGDITAAFSVIDSGAPSASLPAGAPLPGAGALLSEAWALFLDRITTFLGIMLVPMLAVALGLGGVFALGYLGPQLAGTAGIALPIILFALFMILLVVIQLWGQVALIIAVKDRAEGVGISLAFKRGGKLILPYLWVSILSGFITMGGFILLVVPGIIFAIWFSLALCVLVAENERGMNALLKSKEYVRGIWGGVFWRLLSIMVVSMLVALVASFVLSFVPYGDIFSQLIITLFVTPFSMIYLFLLYRHLQVHKGAVTLPQGGGHKAAYIVLAVVGLLVIPLLILGSVVLASLNTARGKANDAKLQADFQSLTN